MTTQALTRIPLLCRQNFRLSVMIWQGASKTNTGSQSTILKVTKKTEPSE
jgi:hypothetical protein